jgi:hypothetical protein
MLYGQAIGEAHGANWCRAFTGVLRPFLVDFIQHCQPAVIIPIQRDILAYDIVR